MRAAADKGANWVITPELAQSGYEFSRKYPVNRLPQFPDPQVQRLREVTRETGVTLFLGLPQHRGTHLHNAVVAIDNGKVVGTHAKVNVLSGKLEGWAQPGRSRVLHVDGVTVGYYVCADAANKRLTRRYVKQGAEILLSSAAWYPLPGMGPLPFWRSVTARTKLPFIVANTTGRKGIIDFRRSPSGAFINGKAAVLHRSPGSALVVMDWNRTTEDVTRVSESAL